jgi:hypothetical protein
MPEEQSVLEQQIKNQTDRKGNDTVENSAGDAGKDDVLKKEMEEAENILKHAHDGLNELGVDDFDDDDDVVESKEQGEVAGDDVITEFEDMLKDADKELQELMGS